MMRNNALEIRREVFEASVLRVINKMPNVNPKFICAVAKQETKKYMRTLIKRVK